MVLFGIKKKIAKADVESFEVTNDLERVFIARDKNCIYHAWSVMTKIDRNSFTYLGDGYWSDNSNAYCEYETSIKPLKGNDAQNFKVIGNGKIIGTNTSKVSSAHPHSKRIYFSFGCRSERLPVR